MNLTLKIIGRNALKASSLVGAAAHACTSKIVRALTKDASIINRDRDADHAARLCIDAYGCILAYKFASEHTDCESNSKLAR